MTANKNPDIGILTYHDGFNFGAFLQVYALQRSLEQFGVTPKVIDYKSSYHTYWEYRCLYFTKRPQVLWGNFRKMRAFFSAHKRLRLSHRMRKKDLMSNMSFDCVVFGSDEIWNYSNPIVGLDPTYFGVGIATARRVAYAASCGNLSEETSVPEVVREGWRQFDHIAVRDENSKTLVERCIGTRVELVLDPTFLVDFAGEEVACPYSDFILIYTTGFTPEVQDAVREYAIKSGRKLISIGYRNAFCDENILGIGPFEFLGYYKAASIVITSMFHGTIFGIKYNKPLAVIVDPYRTNKLATMLKDLGLQDRVTDASGLEQKISESIDYERVNAIVEEKRTSSLNYLKSAVMG